MAAEFVMRMGVGKCTYIPIELGIQLSMNGETCSTCSGRTASVRSPSDPFERPIVVNRNLIKGSCLQRPYTRPVIKQNA